MKFDALPSDILSIIINCLESNGYSLESWKFQLSFLGICRRLRHLALSQVYSCAFFFICDNANASANTARCAFTYDSRSVSTNADLAMENGCLRYIRTVRLYTYYYCSDMVCFDDVLNVFRKYAGPWKSVNALFIDLPYIQLCDSNGQWLDSDKIFDAGAELARQLPAVKKLHFDARIDNIPREFSMGLAHVYDGQWSNLKCAVISNGVLVQMEQLTFLHLVFYSDDMGTPSLQSCKALRVIHIDKLPTNLTWELFGVTKPLSTTTYPCLTKLHIGFCTNNPIEDISIPTDGRVVAFPQLQELDLHGHRAHLPILRVAKLPSRVNRVNIRGYCKSFRNLDGLLNVQFGNLMVHHYNDLDEYGYVDPINMINTLFRNVVSGGSAEYHHFGDEPFDPSVIRLDNITNLHFSQQTQVVNPLCFIKRARCLRRLFVCLSDLNDETASVATNEAASPEKIGPINTSILTLGIARCRKIRRRLEHYPPIVKRLALGLPRLNELTTNMIQPGEFSQFIEENVPVYPHLANIVFKFVNYC